MPELSVRDEILNSLSQSGTQEFDVSNIRLKGSSDHGDVSGFVVSLQQFCRDIYCREFEAVIDRSLVDLWCTDSFVADGWIIPPKWDQFSNDYLTADGYVRLHCNAPHHRDAALHVLGEAKTPQQAKYNALSW